MCVHCNRSTWQNCNSMRRNPASHQDGHRCWCAFGRVRAAADAAVFHHTSVGSGIFPVGCDHNESHPRPAGRSGCSPVFAPSSLFLSGTLPGAAPLQTALCNDLTSRGHRNNPPGARQLVHSLFPHAMASLGDVDEELDALILQYFSTYEELQGERKRLADAMKDVRPPCVICLSWFVRKTSNSDPRLHVQGYLNLSQARYAAGVVEISTLQIPASFSAQRVVHW